MGGPLADGMVAEDSVACPMHDRRFSLATGEPLNHDCGAVARYPVEVRGDELFLAVPVMRPAGEEGESLPAGNGTQPGRAQPRSPRPTGDEPLDPAHPSPSES